MNKTININLASTFFHIDESAYNLLQSYLNKLEKAFKNTQGKEEILRDIEVRIAELFQERKKHPDYVINEKDINEVIDILGQPEDFEVEETQETSKGQTHTASKKLFRDPDDRYIGGVASGLGYYFGIDTTWIRILWLIFGFFSLGIITFIYIILWILIPEAVTTADKLRMKGDPINIATIEKKIKEEFDEVSSKIKDIDYQEVKSSLKKKSTIFFGFLENVLSLIPKVIIKVIGIILLIVSSSGIFAILTGMVLFFIFGTIEWPFNFYSNFLEYDPYPSFAIIIATFLLVFIPFLFLFSLGVRLLYRNSTIYGTVGRFVLFGLWLVALFSLIYMGISEMKNHSVSASKTENYELNIAKTDTLYVRLKEDVFIQDSTLWEYERSKIFPDFNKKNWWMEKNFELNIVKSNNQSNYLSVRQEADGPTYKKAQNNAKEIDYDWEQNQTQLILNPMWEVKTKVRFQNQSLLLKLHLIEGQTVALDQSLEDVLDYPVKNDQAYSSKRTAGKLWRMGREKLECLNCPSNKRELNINYKTKDGTDKLRLNVDSDGITIKSK